MTKTVCPAGLILAHIGESWRDNKIANGKRICLTVRNDGGHIVPEINRDPYKSGLTKMDHAAFRVEWALLELDLHNKEVELEENQMFAMVVTPARTINDGWKITVTFGEKVETVEVPRQEAEDGSFERRVSKLKAAA